MRTVVVHDPMRIPIGRQGENSAVRVVWPGIVGSYAKTYGDGAFSLAVRRPQDDEVYPCTVVKDGEDLVWVISSADVARTGFGSVELTYTVGSTVAKSQIWGTVIHASLSGDTPGEPPEEPAKAWFAAMQAQIGDLSNLTTEARENLVAAINEAARTGSGGSGTISMRTADGYIQYSTDGGKSWNNLAAMEDLKGSNGKDGAPGEPGYTPVKGTDYFTAADKAELVNDVLAALPAWTGGSY